MENKMCNYCGYFGFMIYVHGHQTCPHCKYTLHVEKDPEDQDLFDDEFSKSLPIEIQCVSDLLIQRA
jgi:uncharacterized Zn finger protein (UPF0148 family)